MDNTKVKKQEIRNDIAKKLEILSDSELLERYKKIEDRLFELANFQEAKIALLYINRGCEVSSQEIISRSLAINQIVVLPVFDIKKFRITLFKIDNLDSDTKVGATGIIEPDKIKCKAIPIERLDIAIIPGVAFDEKGGRIGSGEGYYDRLIPKLPITTRKVALALEDQIIQQVPMESHDRYMDIIITENRIIYKI